MSEMDWADMKMQDILASPKIYLSIGIPPELTIMLTEALRQCQAETEVRVRKEMGWRPISEAPKDGTPVIICQAETQSMRWAVWSEGFWRDGQTFAGGKICGCPVPTHFMPLPAPPTASGDNDKGDEG